MAENTKVGIRTISFTITVTQCKNLSSNKGDSFPVNSVARVNFLGETIDSEVVKDNRNPNFNFSVSIERPMTQQLVSQALNSALTVTIVEHSRSQGPNLGGSTGQVMGWVAIDLSPLVCGDSKIPLLFRQLMKNSSEIQEGAEVEVGMTASAPVMTYDEFSKGSILSVFFDSVYSLPPKWIGRGVDSESNPFNYILSFIPPVLSSSLSSGDDSSGTQNNTENSGDKSFEPKPVEVEGSLAFPGDEDETNPTSSILHVRTRSFTRSASPSMFLSSHHSLSSPPLTPSIPSPSPSSLSLSISHPLHFPPFQDDAHFRDSENLNSAPRVKFENGFKIFLNSEDLEKWKETLENAFALHASLAEYKTIPLGKFDFTRFLKPQYAEYEDPNKEKYHGEIVMNLHELLEPGVTTIQGRYKITHLNISSTEAEGNAPIEASDSDKEDDEEDEKEVAKVEDKAMRDSRGDSPKKRNKTSPSKRKSSKKSGDESAQSTNTSNLAAVVPPIELQRAASNQNTNISNPSSTGEKKKKKKAKGATEAGGGGGGGARRTKGRRGKVRDISKLLKVDPIPNPYLVSRSYLHVEITLSKPLVPKIPTPRKLLKPSDYIPKRPPLPRFFQLKEATEEFNQQISAIVSDLASEYKRIFQQTNQGGEAMKEERRRRMTFELNDSGDYFVIKEKMKKSIVRIVKEKFQFQVSNTRNPKELEAFLNELYVYLVDQMHATLQQTLTSQTVFVKPTKTSLASSTTSNSSSISSSISINSVPPSSSSILPPNNSKICADEAELLCKYSQVAAYYQTQVVRVGGAQAWGQYGLYALRVNDKSKAEECLREAIALDDSFPDCLAAYGVVMFVRGNLEKAEVFLRAALATQPTNPVLACLLVKLYATTQREEEMKEMVAICSKVPDAHLQTVKYLLELNVPTLAEQLLSESNENVTTPSTSRTSRSNNSQSNIHANNNAPSLPTLAHLVCMGLVLLTQKDFASASYFISSLQNRAPRDPAVWALAGHIHYMKRNIEEGIACYETALSCIGEPSAPDSIPTSTLTLGSPSFSIFSERAILLRLGDLYMDKRNYNAAKTIFLKACSIYSSPAAWFGTGVALYQLGLYQESESALAEANIHDPNSPVIWGYLTLLCLKILRHREASQAFKLALRLRLSNPVLLCDIGESYLANGNPGIAEECARAAIAHYQEQMEARKKSQPQDRWQSQDPVEEHFERAALLLEKTNKN